MGTGWSGDRVQFLVSDKFVKSQKFVSISNIVRDRHIPVLRTVSPKVFQFVHINQLRLGTGRLLYSVEYGSDALQNFVRSFVELGPLGLDTGVSTRTVVPYPLARFESCGSNSKVVSGSPMLRDLLEVSSHQSICVLHPVQSLVHKLVHCLVAEFDCRAIAKD